MDYLREPYRDRKTVKQECGIGESIAVVDTLGDEYRVELSVRVVDIIENRVVLEVREQKESLASLFQQPNVLLTSFN